MSDQDAQLPDNVESIKLTFDYNILTYDATLWSWFDMFVMNADTGGVLMPLHQRTGPNPGPDFGLFFNTGWQRTSADLTSLAGQKIRVWFGNHQDGWGDQHAVYIDKAKLECKVR